MEPFRTLTGIAAPLPVANIDTDFILSARFLKTVTRTGLGAGLFYPARFDEEGRERPEFILNREPWRKAQILIALDNFGCGSSREHAPWALLDFGIRCIIASSFADIFFGNCVKNGILPIALPRHQIRWLLEQASQAETAQFEIDLHAQSISVAGVTRKFEIDHAQRARMLAGIDDISNSLCFEKNLLEYEESVKIAEPWLRNPALANIRL